MRRIVCALLALGSFAFAQNPANPVYDWKQAKDATFELDPTQYKIVTPVVKRPLRIKIQIEADSGIFIASMPAALIRAKQMNFQSGDFVRANCGQTGVIKETYLCIMHPGEALMVRDKRALGSSLGTMAGVVTRNGDLIDRTTKPNRVNVVISVWACVENCPGK